MAQRSGASVALAYQSLGDDKGRREASPKAKVVMVLLDCVFLGLQPVLVHLSKDGAGHYAYAPLAVNLLVELAKTLFALATLLLMGTGRPGAPMYRSLRSFAADTAHNRLLMVPALLYAVNNYLKFSLQLYFRPTTTKMLGNLKVFVIALLMHALLKKRFTVIQWEALFLLVAGVTVNQLPSACPADSKLAGAVPPLLPMVLCTLSTVVVPSTASVFNEYALKRHRDTSVFLQNFFLNVYGLMFNVVALLATCAFTGRTLRAAFAGQSAVTALLIANNAAQGVLASFFYKFADNLLKKYSSTIATIFTALASWVAFGHELTASFAVGVSIVLVSMHQFFTFGDKQPHKGAQAPAPAGRMLYSPSLEHISLSPAPPTAQQQQQLQQRAAQAMLMHAAPHSLYHGSSGTSASHEPGHAGADALHSRSGGDPGGQEQGQGRREAAEREALRTPG